MDVAPTFSIVVPCLNHARFIHWTINSVLCQQGASFEVAVIDGGSTDGTLEILAGYGDQIRSESRPDRGVYEAVNRGFEMAEGEIVGWLNSDDVYFSVDVLAQVARAFDRHPEVDVFYGDAAVIGVDNRLLRLRLLPDYDRRRLERANMIVQPAVFFRRRVIEREKMKPFLSMDYEYWIRLGRMGYSVQHLPALLAGDRQYAERISVQHHDVILKEMQEYKGELGVESDVPAWASAFDHYRKAPLRLRGLFLVLSLLLLPSRWPPLAFPMWIDSPFRLVYRQLLKRVTEVGL